MPWYVLAGPTVMTAAAWLLLWLAPPGSADGGGFRYFAEGIAVATGLLWLGFFGWWLRSRRTPADASSRLHSSRRTRE